MAGKRGSSRDIDLEIEKKLEKLSDESNGRMLITRSKRLKELQDKLEGSHKVERIKNLKRKLLIPQIVGIVILFPLLMYFNGASLNPLYLPIYHSLLMLFGWIFIIFIGSFIFRILRIRRHKSYSIKYLLARNSMRKSISLAVVALIILGMLYTPYLTQVVNDVSSVEQKELSLEKTDSENFEAEIELSNIGILGLRRLKNITFESTNDTNGWINVTLYQKGENRTESEFSNSSVDGYEETFKSLDTGAFKMWIFHVSSNESSKLEYTVKRKVFTNQQNSFSLLSFLYMGAFVQSAAIFYPFKKRYTGEGIYR
ncbi:MAG: hypothetical protein V5A76_02615 [Candidatus Thermoplasmatota archaeon]